MVRGLQQLSTHENSTVCQKKVACFLHDRGYEPKRQNKKHKCKINPTKQHFFACSTPRTSRRCKYWSECDTQDNSSGSGVRNKGYGDAMSWNTQKPIFPRGVGWAVCGFSFSEILGASSSARHDSNQLKTNSIQHLAQTRSTPGRKNVPFRLPRSNT